MKGILNFFVVSILFSFMSHSIFAQDWPNLERYQDANASIKKATKRDHRIVFMGNSITEGWGNLSPEFFESQNHINRGISGQTTPQMLLRFRADVINLEPEVVVILAGTNDIAGNTGPSSLEMIMDNIKSMSQLAQANDIKVILCSVLPASEFPWNPGQEPGEKIVELNAMIKKFAKKSKFIYVDYYSPLVNEDKGLKAEFSPDGVHPNLAGYQVMEPLVEQAINKVLKKK